MSLLTTHCEYGNRRRSVLDVPEMTTQEFIDLVYEEANDEQGPPPEPASHTPNPRGRPRILPKDHVVVTFRLPKTMVEELEVLAKKGGMSRSALIRQVLQEHVANNGQPRAEAA
jgi:hypothetical protein